MPGEIWVWESWHGLEYYLVLAPSYYVERHTEHNVLTYDMKNGYVRTIRLDPHDNRCKKLV